MYGWRGRRKADVLMGVDLLPDSRPSRSSCATNAAAGARQHRRPVIAAVREL